MTDLQEPRSWMTPEQTGTLLRRYVAEGIAVNGLDFRRATLAWADLVAANLDGANLGGASLVGVDLERASLRGANLEGAHLLEANLQMACLQGANLVWANLGRASLVGADLQWANLEAAYLSGVDLSGADLTEAKLTSVFWSGARLDAGTQQCSRLTRELLTQMHEEGALLDDDLLPHVIKPSLDLHFRTSLSNLDQAAITTVLAAFEAHHPGSDLRISEWLNTPGRARVRLESSNADDLTLLAGWLRDRSWEVPPSQVGSSRDGTVGLDVSGFFASTVLDQLSSVVNRADRMERWRKTGYHLELTERIAWAPDPAKALGSLLHRAFDAVELRDFIEGTVFSPTGWPVDPTELVIALERQGGLTTAWFQQLVAERPTRIDEVAFVAGLYGVDAALVAMSG